MQDNILVSLKNIGLQYQDKIILEKINLEILSNTVTTIIGPNGAGKSSLAKVILGLVEPTTGAIVRNSTLKLAMFHRVSLLID